MCFQAAPLTGFQTSPQTQLASGHPSVSGGSGSACICDHTAPVCGHAYSPPSKTSNWRVSWVCSPCSQTAVSPGTCTWRLWPRWAGGRMHSHAADASSPSATGEAQVLVVTPGGLGQTGGGGASPVQQLTRASSVGVLVWPRQRWPLSRTVSCCYMAGVLTPI